MKGCRGAGGAGDGGRGAVEGLHSWRPVEGLQGGAELAPIRVPRVVDYIDPMGLLPSRAVLC